MSISSSLLDSQGVFIIRTYREIPEDLKGTTAREVGNDGLCNYIFIWKGSSADDSSVQSTHTLVMTFRGILVTDNVCVELVLEGEEPSEFWEIVLKEENRNSGVVSYGCEVFDDLHTGATEGNTYKY